MLFVSKDLRYEFYEYDCGQSNFLLGGNHVRQIVLKKIKTNHNMPCGLLHFVFVIFSVFLFFSSKTIKFLGRSIKGKLEVPKVTTNNRSIKV